MVAVELGVAFSGSVDTPGDIVTAERLGYQHAWVDDSQMLFSDPYIVLALAAERTRTIKLGPGVTNPSMRNPTITANCIATLNALAPGRVMLGIGTGNSSRRALGKAPARLDELARHIDIVRALLTGNSVQYSEGDAPGAEIRFHAGDDRRLNLGDHVPIYVAGTGPRVLGLAGEVGDGVMTIGTVGASLLDLVTDRVASGARRRGRSPADIPLVCMTNACVLRPEESVRSPRVLDAIGPLVLSAANIIALSTPDPDGIPSELRADVLAFRDHFSAGHDAYQGYATSVRGEFDDLLTERLIRATTLTGTPDEIREAVSTMADRGVTKVAIRPLRDVTRELREFADVFA